MIQFKIELHVKISTNKFHSNMHWSERSRVSNEFHMLLLPFKRKFSIDKYPVSIRYDFTWKFRPLDTTNCGSLCKLLEDGMRQINLLEDDNPEHVAETIITSKKGVSDNVQITIKGLNDIII